MHWKGDVKLSGAWSYPLLNSLAVKRGVKVHRHYFLFSVPQRLAKLCGQSTQIHESLHLHRLLPPHQLPPCTPSLRRPPLLSLCPSRIFHRSSQVSPATGAPVWPAELGMIGPWAQAPQAPARKPKALVLQTWGQWGCRAEKHSSLPRSVGRGVWWGGKVVNTDALCFPKPAFLANSCVYTKLSRRGSEGKDSVLGWHHSVLSASDSHHCRQEEGAGESCRGWWTGRIWCQDMQSVYACAFIRDIISCSLLRSLPTHSQSILTHFPEYCFPQISTLRRKAGLGRLINIPNHFNKLPPLPPLKKSLTGGRWVIKVN